MNDVISSHMTQVVIQEHGSFQKTAQCAANSHLNQHGNINWVSVNSGAHQIQKASKLRVLGVKEKVAG